MSNITVAGNVTNSTFVVGNDNFVLNIGSVAEGAIVNVTRPEAQPRFRSNPPPVVKLPSPFPVLLGRSQELSVLRGAVQSSISVSLWARQGMGKSSIARNLSHSINKADAARSVVYLDALGRGRDDVLQALFDTFFESSPSYTPNPASIPTALQKVNSLVFIDNLSLSRDDVGSLLNAAPGCTFILLSTERTLWGEGEVLPLHGLPDPDAVTLFEKELARSLAEPERELCRQVCVLLQNCPDDILKTAAAARESQKPLAALLQELRGYSLNDRSRASFAIADLTDADRKILALLAAAGDNPVPLEFLKNILKDVDVSKALPRLRSLYLVESHSPRYSLTGTLPVSLAAMWDLSSWQSTLSDYSATWLTSQPPSEVVEDSLGMFLHELNIAAERGQWQQLIRLARPLERFLVYYKRWQAWSDLLNLVLRAAQALRDRAVEGWALHELGSRALFQGVYNDARTYLTQALNIRQSLGDKAGIAATRHNLDVLNGLFPPQGGNPPRGTGSGGGNGSRQSAPARRKGSGGKWLITCAVLGILAIVVVGVLALLSNGPSRPSIPTEPPALIPIQPVTIAPPLNQPPVDVAPGAPGSSSGPVCGADNCIQGYVWRNAFDGDQVCVLPRTRDQAAADNAAADSRWVNGAYGPHTCIQGYVWREARPRDDVCVTGEVRDQTARDNAAAASRVCQP